MLKTIQHLMFGFAMSISPFIISLSQNADQAPKMNQAEICGGDSLCISMQMAWDVSWERFYSQKTNLFYDYLSSYEPGKEQSHLPKSDEVKAQAPNLMGYDTGMEDCMISAGVMLSMIIDQYEVTKDKRLRDYADKVYRGIRRCALADGGSGFLARCLCVEDGKSFYINSSRDQYTHAVHGLWLYYHSALASKRTKAEIREILILFAERMKKNVIEENNYDFLRADGSRDSRGISKMWQVQPHEAARLPMIYAAAWDVTGDKTYHDLYRKFVSDAIEQSSSISQWNQPTYSLLQMASSLELLSRLEKQDKLRLKAENTMKRIAVEAAKRSIRADNNAKKLDLHRLGDDWRSGEGLKSKGEYRKSWYCIRESGEAALASLICIPVLSGEQQVLLRRAITRLDYNRVSSSGIFYLQAAYWKARKGGAFEVR